MSSSPALSLAAWLVLGGAPSPQETRGPAEGDADVEANADVEASSDEASSDRVLFRTGQSVEGDVLHVEAERYIVFVPAGMTEPRAVHWGQIASFEADGVRTVVTTPGKPSIAELAERSDEIERQHNAGAALAYVGYGFLSAALGGWTGYGIARRNGSDAQGAWLGAAVVATNVGVGLATVGGVVLFRAGKRRSALREVILGGRVQPDSLGLSATLRF